MMAAEMNPFKFELNQPVAIAQSGEQGKVIARAEYVEAPPSYLIRYRRADGCASEVWWSETVLCAAGEIVERI